MDISSVEYRGYTLVTMPSGTVLVHEGTGTVPPEGKLVGQADNLDIAKTTVWRLVSDANSLEHFHDMMDRRH